MAIKPVPGVIYPTQQGLIAGNSRDSAIQHINNMNAKQNALNQVAGKKNKRRVKSWKRGGAVAVPQFGAKYPEQAGPGTGTNAQIAGLTQTSTQNKANAAYDSQLHKGGSKISKNGGNPNWHWPCSSGGTRKNRKGGNPNWHWPCSSGGKNTSRHMRNRKRNVSSEQEGSIVLGDFKLKYESKQYSRGGIRKNKNKNKLSRVKSKNNRK